MSATTTSRPPAGPHRPYPAGYGTDRWWAETEQLARGEAVRGGPGACSDCHHAKVWHHQGGKHHRCGKCDCAGFAALAERLAA